MGPLEAEQLPEERRHHQRRPLDLQGSQRPEQHLEQAGVGLPLLGHLVHDLEHGHGIAEPVEVLPDGPEHVDGLGLGDGVELAALHLADDARRRAILDEPRRVDDALA